MLGHETPLRSPSRPGARTTPTAPRAGRGRRLPGSGRGRLLALSLAVGLAAPLLSGCTDNPACIFGGDCRTTSDADSSVGTNPATFPGHGAWILNGAPTLQGVFPSGADAHPNTPVVLRFSESISPDTLQNSFSVELVLGDGIAGTPVLIGSPALTGEGRVLLLLPTQPMVPGDYQVLLAENAVVTDLSGQQFARPSSGVLGTFTVTDMPPDDPRVLMTYPADGDTGQSTTPEVVTVFDRAMNAVSVNANSFVVTVDAAPPAQDPAPQAFVPFSAPDPRVYTWRSVNAQGALVPLSTGGAFELVLSPGGNPIVDAQPMPGTLPTTTISFTLSTLAAPLSVDITSMPTDAIGIDNLTGPANLVIDVALESGLTGDRLEILVFGTERVTPPDVPDLTLFTRTFTQSLDANLVQLTAMDMAMLASSSPPRGVLADGPIAIAVRARRGNTVTPVRVLDTDPSTLEIQDPLQDLAAPVFAGFGTSGNELTTFRSSARDLVVVGRTGEELAAVEVVATTSGGAVSNEPMPGMLAPVVGSNDSGLFIAAPVPLGNVDPDELPMPFTLTLYDRAMNSTSIGGAMFVQSGALGPDDPGVPAGMISVEVVDARTLEPIQGAVVFTLQRDMGVVSAIPGGNDVTGASGVVTLPTAAMGETIVTVEATNYDLFTFTGTTSNRLSVPLTETGGAAGLVSGVVQTSEQNANSFTLQIADSRFVQPGSTLAAVGLCATDPFGGDLTCPYTNLVVQGGVLGTQTFLATSVPANEFNYNPSTFLRAFSFLLPLGPVSGGLQNTMIDVPVFLDDPSVDPEDLPVDFPAHVLSENATVGLDFMNLAGVPEVTIQANVPGLPRSSTVGRGVPFQNMGMGTWNVRAAYSGRADGTVDAPTDELGDLVLNGTIDPDLIVREEFVDMLSNRSGARHRLSSLPGTIEPLNVATIIAPAPGGATGGLSFNLAFSQAVTDAIGLEGLYRVTLVDSSLRRWDLWAVDTPDASGNVVVHVPDLAIQGATGLDTGGLVCTISAYTLPPGGMGDPSLTSLLFTDVERVCEGFSHTAAVTFLYPN